MIYSFTKKSSSDAATEAWKRCFAAAKLAAEFPSVSAEVASFIDSHFKLIDYASTSPHSAAPYRFFPERSEPFSASMLARWGVAVHTALSDVRPPGTPVGRLLQKASPHVGSVRYIGAQMERACNSYERLEEHELLRDILRCCALGTWAVRPETRPEARFAVWRESANQQYARIGAQLKSSDVQACIKTFTCGVASMSLGSIYVLKRRRQYPAVATLLSLERAAGPGPSAWPLTGFAIPGDVFGKMAQALQPDCTGAPPSAKRVKSMFGKYATDDDARVVRGRMHKAVAIAGAPLEAAEAAKQRRNLPPTYALLCTNCGTWRTRPRGGQRPGPASLSGVLVDLDTSAISCSSCMSEKVNRVLLNGYQVRNQNKWGRLCTRCGDFGSDMKQHGTSTYCTSCFALETLAAQPVSKHCWCGRAGVKVILGTAGTRFALTHVCTRHAAG